MSASAPILTMTRDGAGAALPRLTKPQMARLVEIGTSRFRPSFGTAPVLTSNIQHLGCVEPKGGRVARSGRVMEHAEAVLTPLGIRILATLPGPEFDRFRAALATLPGDPHARTD